MDTAISRALSQLKENRKLITGRILEYEMKVGGHRHRWYCRLLPWKLCWHDEEALAHFTEQDELHAAAEDGLRVGTFTPAIALLEAYATEMGVLADRARADQDRTEADRDLTARNNEAMRRNVLRIVEDLRSAQHDMTHGSTDSAPSRTA